jgi:AcrR family transcriptional regulator
MTKRDLSLEKILAAAAARIDQSGRNDVTIGELACDLGVRPSALYNHISGLDELRRAVAIDATNEAADQLVNAVVAVSGTAAIRALALTYRAFAIEHPGRFAALLLPPTAQDDPLAQAQSRIVDIFVRATESTGATGDAAVHAARAVCSAIHGFVALESVDAFTSKVSKDASFDHLVASILRGLLPRPGRSRVPAASIVCRQC